MGYAATNEDKEVQEHPVCPNCKPKMEWFNSDLVSPTTLRHLFYCPTCHRTKVTYTDRPQEVRRGCLYLVPPA